MRPRPILSNRDNASSAWGRKRCCRCGEEKEVTQFWKDRNKRDGLDPCCKACEKDPNSRRCLRRGDPSVVITVQGGIAEVELSNGKFALIDAGDAEVVGR